MLGDDLFTFMIASVSHFTSSQVLQKNHCFVCPLLSTPIYSMADAIGVIIVWANINCLFTLLDCLPGFFLG